MKFMLQTEAFENTLRVQQLMKDRKHNRKTKRGKRTNNDKKNTTLH